MNKKYYKYDFNKTLPPTLTSEEQKILVKDINNPETVKKLVIGNLRLVLMIAKRFQNTGIDMDDLTAEGVMGLIKAIKYFNPEKGLKLSTFSAKCIENEILMLLRKNKKEQYQSLEDVIYTDIDGDELKIEDIVPDDKIRTEEQYENAQVISNTMTLALNNLTKSYKIAFLLKLCGFKQREIAEKCQLTQASISRILNKVYDRCHLYSEMAVDKNQKYKFIFMYAEECYDFLVFIDICPNLQKDFSDLKDSLCGDELSWYEEFNVRKEKDYFIMKLPKSKETFLFIARFIEMFEEE